MNTQFASSRLTLLALACSAGLALMPNAQAAYNGKLLVGDQVPDWAVGNEYNCSGVLITPRVVITSAECNNGAPVYFHRKTGQQYTGRAISYPVVKNVLGNVSIFITDAKFGGDAAIQTAPVASYLEQKKELVDGNDELTQGAQLVFYTRDSLNIISGDKSNRQMRVVDAYLDWTNYRGAPDNGDAVPDGPPLIYRSASRYRQLEPDYLTGSIGYFYSLGGPNFTDQDADDAVIYTAGLPNARFTMDSPVTNDDGGGLFLRKPNGDLRLVGTQFGGWAHVRLSHYWPWVVNTLEEQGLRQDAILLSQKVLGVGNWGENNQSGKIGQIYVYDNPFTSKMEFFRLVHLGADQRYGYFPINQKDNSYWEYLGTTLPDMEQATTDFKTWGNSDSSATPGDLYVYDNPFTHDVEYFRLKSAGTYGYFPTNKTSNADWTYLGTDLPTRTLKYPQL
ncbi:hypothetical protein ACVW0Y_004519 [Pseudomonas sp. TE3786]